MADMTMREAFLVKFALDPAFAAQVMGFEVEEAKVGVDPQEIEVGIRAGVIERTGDGKLRFTEQAKAQEWERRA